MGVSAIVALWGFLLLGPVMAGAAESDLAWMLPYMAYSTDGLSWAREIGWILSPWPINFGQPAVKLWLAWVPMSQSLVWGMALHAAAAFLLWQVVRAMGLAGRVAGWAGLIYLTMFVHFHAYVWPTAVQHVIAVVTVLLLLWLYLRAEASRAAGEEEWVLFYGAAMTCGVVASLQRSALLAPVLVFLHLLLSPGGAARRFDRYRRWVPLFLISLFYPVWMLARVGDVIINDRIAAIPGPAWAKMLLLLGTAAAALGVVALILRPTDRMASWRRILARRGMPGVLLGAAVWLVTQDRRQWFLPYNALVPWISTLGSFLRPFQTADRIDPMEISHYVPPEVSGFLILASILLVVLFLTVFCRKQPALWVWIAWYAVGLVHVLHHYASFPVRIPSRYFIYLSPPFAVVFSAVGLYLFDLCAGRLKLRGPVRERWWDGFLALLCVANLLAIPPAVFRGKLVNNYLLYDEIRTSQLIREDLGPNPDLQLQEAPLYVSGLTLMPLGEMFSEYLPEIPPSDLSFKLLLAHAMDRRLLSSIHINEKKPSAGPGRIYRVAGVEIFGEKDRVIGEFSQRCQVGWRRLDEKDWDGARESFQAAVRARPFLLNYLLPRCRLSDVRWLGGDEQGLREWVEELGRRANQWKPVPAPKRERIREVMDGELREYALSLYALSYLEKQAGREEASQAWFKQIYFLERDGKRLEEWLTEAPRMRQRPWLKERWSLLEDIRFYQNPLPWQKDDYGFGRFMARLMLGVDVLSRWDRQGAAVWP